MALSWEVGHWSLTALREDLVKLGSKVVKRSRCALLQVAEVAVPPGVVQSNSGADRTVMAAAADSENRMKVQNVEISLWHKRGGR